MSTEAKKKEMDGQARLAELEARESARQVRQAASQEAQNIRENTQRRKARARAMMGKSGIAMSGSALLVADTTAREAEKQAALRIDEGNDQATNILSQGQSLAHSYRSKAYYNPWSLGGSLLDLGKKIYEEPNWKNF